MNPLLQFYRNTTEREAVRAFMNAVLSDMAVDRAFKGETFVGIKEAKECVDRTFDKLEEVYGKIKEEVITSPR